MQLPKTGDVLLEKYVLEERLGEGGMGIVFAARHRLLAQRVAVKLIRPEIAMDGEAVARFVNEARAAAHIASDHVARVLDVGMLEDRYPYMVLEYLDGVDLAQSLRARGPLPVADVADYLLQVIEALAHAHALGIVHRYLKPSNLFLARRPDGTLRVKVLDFGISKARRQVDVPSAQMTKKNAILGSPHYMSPEQLRDAASVDHRSDIWALGVVAYELLSGRTPFGGENAVAVFAAIQEAEPTRLRDARKDVDAELEGVILKCLERERASRFESVTDLGRALAPFGTAVAARALENAKLIVPLGSVRSPPQTSLRLDAEDTGSEEAVISATLRATPVALPQASTGETENALSSSRGVTAPERRRGVGVAVGVTAVVAAGALVILAWPARVPVATLGEATSSARAVSRDAWPTPSAVAAPSTSSVVLALPVRETLAVEPTVPSPSISALPRRPTIPNAATPHPVTSASAVVSSPPRCVPPFTYDGNGTKRWKPECLSQ